MTYTLAQIAAALSLDAVGDTSVTITALAEPASAASDHLAIAMTAEYEGSLAEGQARVALLRHGADWQALGLVGALLAPRPRFALSGLSAMMDLGPGYGLGVHPSAVIDPSAHLEPEVSVGPLCVVGPGARIGAGCVLGPHVCVGSQVHLGEGALIHAGVKLAARVRIGPRAILHPGVVIGADGFSFVTPEPSGAEKARASLGKEGTDSAQVWARIHALGSVVLGADVEVGANTCIDAGTIRETRIGDGCKIDNLVQIGHNVTLGQDSLVCALAGIGGSAQVGNNVVVGGKVAVADNTKIGDRVVLGGGSIVLSNVPDGRMMLGYPAVKMDMQLDIYKALRRLPRLFRDVDALKKAVSNRSRSD